MMAATMTSAAITNVYADPVVAQICTALAVSHRRAGLGSQVLQNHPA
jgi:hypothetical protein